MSPENEKYLWEAMKSPTENIERSPRYVIQEMLDKGMIQSPKQAWRTLEKWCARGIYEYGVSLDLGWKCGSVNRGAE